MFHRFLHFLFVAQLLKKYNTNLRTNPHHFSLSAASCSLVYSHAASRRSSLYGAVRWKEKPSRYNWAYSNGSSMASAFNVHNPIQEWSLSSSQLPNSQCEAYNQQKYKHQCCSCVDCILQIFLSSYRISLSFNQSFVINIRSISISSPSHFYFVLYCFIDFSCPCICPYESS